ncbi:MAG TPA: DNA-processing protein DprA [Candidatus Limnocylindrales bacterium]|nr:DNA-processing protein DprA [Candidatus Limnocylindrales bacterium]
MNNNDRSDIIYLNALNRVKSLGPLRIGALLEHFGTAEEAWKAPLEEFKAVIKVKDYAERLQQERHLINPEQEWELLQKKKVKCLTLQDHDYPPLLKQIVHPPQLLYYLGHWLNSDRPMVAIVGSRRCTFYGKEVANRLAIELAEAGVAVVSGMALGVDTAAHRGALEKKGYTAAVLGCGVDQCYPPENADLREDIIASGVVLSEFSVGVTPLPGHFPQRNRIISGLSLGTVVVEATAKSGALITAHFALEQNREVFAVPGNIGSPYSRGCHRLIKEGARLIESAADILEELALGTQILQQLTMELVENTLSDNEKTLLARIPYQPIHMDDLIRLHISSAAAVSAVLLSLELKKYIRQLPGKYFCRI